MLQAVELTTPVLGSLLNTCSHQRLLDAGRSLHAHILKRESRCLDSYLQNHLVNFYSKCEKLECAHRVFDRIPDRNTVSWTALISGYDQCGSGYRALQLFSLMVSRDPHSCPDQFTYASALSACSKHGRLDPGMQVHCHALRRGFLGNVMVSNVLISLYMACSHVTEAELVFREILEPDEVSWNSLISGLYRNGCYQATLETFRTMRELNVTVTSFMLSTAIAACSEDGTDGRRIHGLMVKTGLDTDRFPGSALIRMYSKFNMEEASKAFQVLSFKDVTSWNSLIQGYGECDQGEKGLQVFNHLMKSGLKPDGVTTTAVVGICTSLVMVDGGKQMHSLSTKTGLDTRIRVCNSMIDMYAKCGNLEDGFNVFRQMKGKNVISWTTMMGGLAHHGRAHEALQLFAEMKREGLNPNKVTYTCILSACSHGGLVNVGRCLFDSMEIEAEEEHYICMVRLLAGGRRFEELEEFIGRAPEEHKELLWQSFLVACKNLGEWERAVEVAERMVMEGSAAKPHTLVLLSSVFAGAGRWEEVEKMREVMKERGLKKEPACSWIEVDKKVQIFGIESRM